MSIQKGHVVYDALAVMLELIWLESYSFQYELRFLPQAQRDPGDQPRDQYRMGICDFVEIKQRAMAILKTYTY